MGPAEVRLGCFRTERLGQVFDDCPSWKFSPNPAKFIYTSALEESSITRQAKEKLNSLSSRISGRWHFQSLLPYSRRRLGNAPLPPITYSIDNNLLPVYRVRQTLYEIGIIREIAAKYLGCKYVFLPCKVPFNLLEKTTYNFTKLNAGETRLALENAGHIAR